MNKEDFDKVVEWKGKADKYDELKSWWLWLERRTHDGKTNNTVLRTYLKGIKQLFESDKEDK